MNILGINDSHNASACLLVDDKLVAAIQEERLCRVKNWSGFPIQSIQWVLDYGNIRPEQVDYISFLGYSVETPVILKKLRRAYQLAGLPFVPTIWKLSNLPSLYSFFTRPIRQRKRRADLKSLGLLPDRAQFIEHHLAHAASAYYGWGKTDGPVLVLTADGSGDGLSATVNVGDHGSLTRLAAVKTSASLGILYALVTLLLGMTPAEHETKVMGLAAYAPNMPVNELKARLTKQFEFDGKDGLSWKRTGGQPDIRVSYPSLKSLLEEYRFDVVAGGVQAFLEDWLCEWVSQCVQSTGIRRVALAGGVFMNVKANMAIGKLNCVDELFIFPSCGDETGAIGAAWWTYIEHAHKNPEPLQHLYLGAKYGQDEIAPILKKSQNLHGFTLEYLEDTPRSLAELIASGEIVAYFGGRMEFGARALGNRSIFADPRKPELIHTINEFIKGRDFWMPFAPAIIDSSASKYLINPKSFTAPYMILAFDTTESRTELSAAIHPWDYTVRPQMVTLDQSPFLYQVVREFEKLTGCGAVLNTSFNIHGEPIVMSPQDAIDVFVRSGLKHLIIETSWLRKTQNNTRPHNA